MKKKISFQTTNHSLKQLGVSFYCMSLDSSKHTAVFLILYQELSESPLKLLFSYIIIYSNVVFHLNK